MYDDRQQTTTAAAAATSCDFPPLSSALSLSLVTYGHTHRHTCEHVHPSYSNELARCRFVNLPAEFAHLSNVLIMTTDPSGEEVIQSNVAICCLVVYARRAVPALKLAVVVVFQASDCLLFDGLLKDFSRYFPHGFISFISVPSTNNAHPILRSGTKGSRSALHLSRPAARECGSEIVRADARNCNQAIPLPRARDAHGMSVCWNVFLHCRPHHSVLMDDAHRKNHQRMRTWI